VLVRGCAMSFRWGAENLEGGVVAAPHGLVGWYSFFKGS